MVDFEKFVDAVNIVCMDCVCGDEETCKNCPVRLSVDYYRKK